MVVEFKYDVGQKVYYDEDIWIIVAQHLIRTKHAAVISYNLRSAKEYNDYRQNVWEEDLKVLRIVK